MKLWHVIGLLFIASKPIVSSGIDMNMKEIAWKSWGVYKKNFLKLVIPFLVLAMVAPLAFDLGRSEIVAEYLEAETTVVVGDNLNSPDFLDANDEAYFEVEAVENDGLYGLEILHDSKAIPATQIAGRWIGVSLNFKSENIPTYHLEIYNFATASWENLQSGKVGSTEVIGGGIIKTNSLDHLRDVENYVRIRLYTTNEENAHRVQVDHLTYGLIEPTQQLETGIGYLAFLFALIFCFGIAIGTTHKAMAGELVKFGDALMIAVRNYIRMSVAALLLLMPLAGLLYPILTQPWGTFLIPFALLLPFFCVYTLHGVVIRHLSPLGGIKNSFQIVWENAGTTLALWLQLVFVWILSVLLSIVGWVMLWLFLPLWVVMLSVTYIDRTGELKMKAEGTTEE